MLPVAKNVKRLHHLCSSLYIGGHVCETLPPLSLTCTLVPLPVHWCVAEACQQVQAVI